MIGQKRQLVSVVEAVYRLDVDTDPWLQALADVLAAMHGTGPGVMVYLYDASKPAQGVAISQYALSGLDENFARGTILHNLNTPPEDTRRVYRRGVQCGTVSEVLAPQNMLPIEHESFTLSHDLHGVEDAWGLSASDLDCCGVGVAAPLEQVSSMSERRRELWTQVGVHLTIAYRLRRGQRADANTPAAVLKPNGMLVHAEEGEAYESRDELGFAVRQIDRARSKALRDEPDEALSLWRGLVEGRWSLVERWDSDGRRFVLAHPNDPRFETPQALRQRERQVAAYASQGDSIAHISYALGLDAKTVEALLASAMEKLGIESRESLIWLREHFS